MLLGRRVWREGRGWTLLRVWLLLLRLLSFDVDMGLVVVPVLLLLYDRAVNYIDALLRCGIWPFDGVLSLFNDGHFRCNVEGRTCI